MRLRSVIARMVSGENSSRSIVLVPLVGLIENTSCALRSLMRLLDTLLFGVDRPRARFALERFMEVAAEERATGICIDVGCGRGDHVDLLKKNGLFREVHGLDLGERPRDKEDRYFSTHLESFDAPHPYDAIWCSHTLE